MRSRRRGAALRSTAGGLVALLLFVAVACSGSDETDGTDPPTPDITPTTEAPRPDDGVLKIGVLAPRSGPGAAIGQSIGEAATRAIGMINIAGGIGGQRVELVPEDEGTTELTAREAIDALLAEGVDAVVGPTSSLVALDALGDLMAGGVLTCSPTASSLALDEYPNSDLFFRTVPSDRLQAMAIAELAEQTGARTAAVAYLDDTYGRPLAQATMEALEGRQLAVAHQEPFNAADEDLAVHANALIGADAGVILVIGDADEGTRMLAALGEAVVGVEPAALPDVVVNGAMRQPPAPLVQALPPALRDVVRGVAPVAMPTTPDEPQGPYATNAADCVNLIALAAAQAESDNPADMSAQIDEVSSTGVTCPDFATCVALLQDNNIDYDGPSGAVEIGADGNPERGRFEVFGFDANGVDQFQRPLSISS